MLAYLLLGGFIGWFGSEMLMRKTFRVFASPLGWGGFALCCGVICLLMFGMRADLFGYERHVPDPARVEYVVVSVNGEHARISDPESIALAEELQRTIVARKAWNLGGEELSPAATAVSYDDYYNMNQTGGAAYERYSYLYCDLHYFLSNGRTMLRSYRLRYNEAAPMAEEQIALLQRVLNTPDAIAARNELLFPITRDNMFGYSVDVQLTAAECAEEAGYDSPEDYILLYLEGYTEAELRTYSPEARAALAADAAYSRSVNGYGSKYYASISRAGGELPEPDYDELYFEYSYVLTPDEMYELYSTCVVPDLADGTLGRVWAVTENVPEYLDGVYSATISIHSQRKWEDNPERPRITANSTRGEMEQSYFYTVPTTDSVRTVEWLTAHGVKLHTAGEVFGRNPY